MSYQSILCTTRTIVYPINHDYIMRMLRLYDFFFRFLGKYLSQFISCFIEEGVARVDILNEGFDYTKWKKAQERQKKMVDPTPPFTHNTHTHT